MKDIQGERDSRNLDVDKVGVKGVVYPIDVLDRTRGKQSTVAKIDMYVNLPREYRGAHMSRFLEILNKYRGEITINNIPSILDEMKERLDAESAHLEIRFPYFMEKCAPVSGEKGLVEYRCSFVASSNMEFDFILGVSVPVMTLCPCSKEISDKGAHNQRGIVRVEIRTRAFFWLEELIEIVEDSASSPLYPILKRVDEKVVTERSYDNPAFVEDVVRNVALRLKGDERVTCFRVEAEDMESIHPYNAYAMIAEESGGNIRR